jgi:beta-glucosidase
MDVLALVLHILVSFAACAEAITRADFPPGFTFGTASSAYQVQCYPNIHLSDFSGHGLS